MLSNFNFESANQCGLLLPLSLKLYKNVLSFQATWEQCPFSSKSQFTESNKDAPV